MTEYDNKLIILRGNSGAGKSTVAKQLRESSQRKIAIVEQDYLRRSVLKEKEIDNGDNIGLIERTVRYALEHGYDVILEGILHFPRYGDMLERLIMDCPDNYVYCFDVSFEETVGRHVTKPNAHEFGEEEMRKWYHPNIFTGLAHERIIPESNSLDQTVAQILTDTGL